MADPYIGEIRLFPYNFAPNQWLYCDGSLVSVREYQALFAVVGTTYGGDGQNTFGLPNLQGLSPLGTGTGPGLTPRVLSETGGTATTTVDINSLPNHNHIVTVSVDAPAPNIGQTGIPSAATIPARENTPITTFSATAPNTTFAPLALSVTGGSLPHNNQQPYLPLGFCIATNGIFPIPND
jgi:microcystin-dependent protein